jgi:pimeloyl-ACP methyl ester carboxylesterase
MKSSNPVSEEELNASSPGAFIGRVKSADSPRNSSRLRRWLRLGAGLLGIYILTILILVAGEKRMAFAGWTFPKPWLGFPAGAVVEDLTLESVDRNSINAWWLPSPDWSPNDGALIYIHGNSENLSTCGKTLTRWSNEMHTGVLGIDYPGFGRSTGSPNEQSCYAAAETSFNWLVREKKVAPKDIILVGQSIGGAIATELARRRPCRMLLTSGAFTSFPDAAQHRFFWLPARYLVRLRFDNLEKMRNLETPVFITHGTNDHTVPFSQGERLAEAARGPKRFYPMEGHGHSQPKSPEFFERVRQFLRETSRANTGTGHQSK